MKAIVVYDSLWGNTAAIARPREAAMPLDLVLFERVGEFGVGEEFMVGEGFEESDQVRFFLGCKVDARDQVTLVRMQTTITCEGPGAKMSVANWFRRKSTCSSV